MTYLLTRKKSTSFLSKYKLNINNISLKEEKNSVVNSQRYKQLLVLANIYINNKDKIITTKKCKALYQILLNAD